MHKVAVILIALLVLLPMIVSAEESQPLSLAARLERTDVVAGHPALLSLTIHNSGTVTADIGGSAWDPSSFLFDIKDSAGNPVPQTAYGRRILTSPAWAMQPIQSLSSTCRNRLLFLAPGHDRLYHYDLTRLFDLSRTGKYTINVKRAVWLPRISDDATTQTQPLSLTASPLVLHINENASSRSGITPLTASPTHRRFLYIANRASREDEKHDPISCNEILDDGHLTPTVGNPALGGAGDTGMAATSDGRFLYMMNAKDSCISQFEIGSDGALRPLSPATVSTLPKSVSLIIDPANHFLYAMGFGGTTLFTIGTDSTLTQSHVDTAEDWHKDPSRHIAPVWFASYNPDTHVLYTFTFAWNIRAYHLDKLGTATFFSESSPYVCREFTIDQQGRFAFSLSDNEILPIRLESDGRFTALPSVPLPDPPSNTASQYSAIVVDPSDRFLLALDASASRIIRYRIAADGSLALLGVTSSPGRPSAALFNPKDRLVYTLNNEYSSLTTYSLGDDGSLTRTGIDTPCRGEYGDAMIAVNVPVSPNWGISTDGLVLSTRLERQVFNVGQEIVLTVVLKNVTSQPITLGTGGTDLAAFRLVSLPSITLTDPSGYQHPQLPINLLAAGRDLESAADTSTVSLVLPPGGQRQYRFVLSRLADLTLPADYGIKIVRTLPDGKTLESLVKHFRIQNPYDGLTGQDQDAMPPLVIDSDGQGTDISITSGASPPGKNTQANSAVS